MKLYFTPKEFSCPCCGVSRLSWKLLIFLNAIRVVAGEPVIITSGYRCQSHNKKVGGASHSAHLKGLAADIRLKFGDFDKLANIVMSLLFYNLHLGEKFNIGYNRNKGFIHLDVEDRGYYRLWTYKKDFLRYNIIDKADLVNAIEGSKKAFRNEINKWKPFLVDKDSLELVL